MEIVPYEFDGADMKRKDYQNLDGMMTPLNSFNDLFLYALWKVILHWLIYRLKLYSVCFQLEVCCKFAACSGWYPLGAFIYRNGGVGGGEGGCGNWWTLHTFATSRKPLHVSSKLTCENNEQTKLDNEFPLMSGTSLALKQWEATTKFSSAYFIDK